MANIRRAFQVESLKGKVKTTITEVEKLENGSSVFHKREVEAPAGFMVYFPQGHSIRVESQEQLERLGFAGHSGMVDMDTGDFVEDASPTDLKSVVERATAPPRVEV